MCKINIQYEPDLLIAWLQLGGVLLDEIHYCSDVSLFCLFIDFEVFDF